MGILKPHLPDPPIREDEFKTWAHRITEALLNLLNQLDGLVAALQPGDATVPSTSDVTINNTYISKNIVNTSDLSSGNYVPGYNGAGFYIDSDYAEFAWLKMQGIIRTAVISQENVISALGGAILQRPGGVLAVDMTAADNQTVEIDGDVDFHVGDILRIKGSTPVTVGADDDFTGDDGDPLNSVRWDANSSYVYIDGNRAYCPDGRSFTSKFTVSGDFDIQATYDYDETVMTNSFAQVFRVKIDNNNYMMIYAGYFNGGDYLAVQGMANGVYFYDDRIMATSTTSVRITRSGTTWNAWYYAGGWIQTGWTAATQTMGSAGDVDVTFWNYRWDASPDFDGWWDDFKVVVGTVNLSGSGEDEWLKVTAANGNVYTVERDKPDWYDTDDNPVWNKGVTVLNYGASGEKFILLQGGDYPSIEVHDHAGSPWDATTRYLKIGDKITFIGADSSNANMTIGLTLNQGTNDDEIIALKSDDIGHGMTTHAEDDTYASFQKETQTTGGLRINTFSEATRSLKLDAFFTNEDTTKSTGGTGAVTIEGLQRSGATYDDCAANTNLLAVRGSKNSTISTAFIVDVEGLTWQTGTVKVEMGGGECFLAHTDANSGHQLSFDANRGAAHNVIGRIRGYWNGNETSRIDFLAGLDTSNKDDGAIRFSTYTDSVTVKDRMFINESGEVYIGPNYITLGANANMTYGLTVDNWGAGGHVFALKDSAGNFAHGYTSKAETETFYAMGQYSSENGGVLEHGFNDTAANTVWSHFMYARAGAGNTTKGTGGRGYFEFTLNEHNGAGAVANTAADANLCVWRTRVGGSNLARWILDEDGDTWQAGNAILVSGQYVQADEVRAIDTDGIKLSTAGGTALFSWDGDVTVGISVPTSDASDTGASYMAGGGTTSVLRGGSIYCYGNEHATYPGDVGIFPAEGNAFVMGSLGINQANPSASLEISTDSGGDGILLKNTGNYRIDLISDSNRSAAEDIVLRVDGKWNGTSIAQIDFRCGDDTTNKDDGVITFRTAVGGALTEHMRIEQDGGVFLKTLKSGATAVAAGAGTNELWVTSGHATLPNGVLMLG